MIKSLIKKIINKISSSKHENCLQHFGLHSYSQCGEDIIINYIFQLRGIEKPTYLDIGAHNPYFLSNTAFFYKKGCRGINIEANSELINNFKVERPEDINLNIGISDKETIINFYIMEDSTLSTFSKEECDEMVKIGKRLKEVKSIPTKKIMDVLNTYNKGIFPDLMSIDVEGLDFEILESINFEKTSPKVICVEAAEYSPIGAGKRRDELIDFLVSKGYYEYANTNLNAIMVRSDFWFI